MNVPLPKRRPRIVPDGPEIDCTHRRRRLRRKELGNCNLLLILAVRQLDLVFGWHCFFVACPRARLFVTHSTYQPTKSWGCEQVKTFQQHSQDTGLGAEYLLHDRDTKFTATFDQSCKEADLHVIKLQYRSPNTNAYVERFIQTLQQECLDYFIVFGQQHMDYLVREMVQHYHSERPHQSKDNHPLLLSPSPEAAVSEPTRRHKRTRSSAAQDQIVCEQRLGGLLMHYHYHRAA